MTVRIVNQPTVEPITLQQAKDWCRVDPTGDSAADSAQDGLLTMLIQSMREYAENLTARSFVQRTLELSLPCFPEGSVIELPRPPLVSVTSVKFVDFGGTLQTVDPLDYQVDTAREPGRVKPAYLKFWLGTRNDFNAVQVRYEAGYAPTSSPTDYRENVPASVKTWMQARLATLWENREQILGADFRSSPIEIPRDFADGLLDSLKVGTLFG